MRILLTYVLPIFLPSLLYFGWLAWRTRRVPAGDQTPPTAVPWSWLIIAGIALTITIAVGTALMGEGNVGKTYMPPHLDEQGNIVPGQFR
jgi:hypothetical protein